MKARLPQLSNLSTSPGIYPYRRSAHPCHRGGRCVGMLRILARSSWRSLSLLAFFSLWFPSPISAHRRPPALARAGPGRAATMASRGFDLGKPPRFPKWPPR